MRGRQATKVKVVDVRLYLEYLYLLPPAVKEEPLVEEDSPELLALERDLLGKLDKYAKKLNRGRRKQAKLF